MLDSLLLLWIALCEIALMNSRGHSRHYLLACASSGPVGWLALDFLLQYLALALLDLFQSRSTLDLQEYRESRHHASRREVLDEKWLLSYTPFPLLHQFCPDVL